jgi:hypothetical protein
MGTGSPRTEAFMGRHVASAGGKVKGRSANRAAPPHFRTGDLAG